MGRLLWRWLNSNGCGAPARHSADTHPNYHADLHCHLYDHINFYLTPSPTPTNTATSTPSATPTFTSTSTYTPSATATFTPTSTSTKTSAPTPGRNGNPFFPLSGFFINTATGTNTPTASPTNTTTFLPLPTQPTVSAIPDAQPTSTPQEEQPQTQGWFSWQFCAGLSSLLTGLSLFWIVRRGRKRNRFSVRGKIR